MTDPRIERIQRFPVPIASPAAGAEFTITATGQGIWRIKSIVYTLATSAVVGSRVSTLEVNDQTTTFQRIAPGSAQAASLTWSYAGYPGTYLTGPIGVHVDLSWPTDGVLLYPGYRMQSKTDALDVGDQYSQIAMLVEELPSGRYLYVTPVEPYDVEAN